MFLCWFRSQSLMKINMPIVTGLNKERNKVSFKRLRLSIRTEFWLDGSFTNQQLFPLTSPRRVTPTRRCCANIMRSSCRDWTSLFCPWEGVKFRLINTPFSSTSTVETLWPESVETLRATTVFLSRPFGNISCLRSISRSELIWVFAADYQEVLDFWHLD